MRTRPKKRHVVGALGLSAAATLSVLTTAEGSSHREAPLISEDPVADATDVYAFVSPDDPDTVTMIANYNPLEEAAGGPNFDRFGDDVLYELNVDNDGDAVEDVSYEFRFRTQVQNRDTFLYNTGPITSIDDPDFNVRQYYTVTKVENGRRTVLGNNLATPPVRIGNRSTPNYGALRRQSIHHLGDTTVFAGQRDDPFFVDLGSLFDLLGLRPLNGAHAIPQAMERGIDTIGGYNVHSIAIQVPIDDIVEDDSVVGVWTTSSRRKNRVLTGDGRLTHSGPWVQVSRLGMPLVNEVVIPLRDKDRFNASLPRNDAQFGSYVLDPEPGRLIPALYPVFDCFPSAPRNDLAAVFLTGLPGLNQPAGVRASEQMRLNTSVRQSGFPNGRWLADDVVDTGLKALAGAAVEGQECFGQAPNNALTDGVFANDKSFMRRFPYLADPFSGYISDENGPRPRP